jgi:hypothetical protein
MDGFRNRKELIQYRAANGYYAFMDYAVPYWVRHLEMGLSGADDSGCESIHDKVNTIAESLDAFLESHYTPPTKNPSVSQGNAKRLDVFEGYSFYDELQKAIISARKELTFFGEMKPGEVALDLTQVVKGIRDELETLYTRLPDGDQKTQLQAIYGKNMFKCPRLSCRYFYVGFSVAGERDQHIDKHLRPFRCDVIGCPSTTLGFSATKELAKHKKEVHDVHQDDEIDFPDEEVITHEEHRMELPQPKRTAPTEPRAVVPVKRRRITEFHCEQCGKIFKKKFNFESHLVTHSGSRDFVCNICGAAFARNHDRDRHEKTHEEKAFICGGILKNGQSWGCQKRFARPDTLRSHHKSTIGQTCIRPWIEEQQAGLYA